MAEAATVATEILAQMHATSRMRMASEAPQPTSYQIIECYIQRLLDDKDRYHTVVTVEETLEIERLNNQIINEQLKVTELKLQLADERRRRSGSAGPINCGEVRPVPYVPLSLSSMSKQDIEKSEMTAWKNKPLTGEEE